MNENPPYEPAEELDIRDYWRILRRRWRIIVSVASVIFLCGTVYTLWQTPQYLGETSLLVEYNKGSAVMLAELNDLGTGAIPIETEMEILKSRTLAEQVVRELSLDAVPIDAPMGTRLSVTGYRSERFRPEARPVFVVRFEKGGRYEVLTGAGEALGSGVAGEPFNGKDVAWTLKYEGPASVVRFTKIPFTSAVAGLRSGIGVSEQGKKTNVIRVAVNHPDASLARDIANTLAAAYLLQNLTRKGQEATQTLEFIEGQLDTIRSNLEAGERQLDELKSAKGIYILSETAKKLINQITQLEVTKTDLELQQRHMARLSEALSSAGDKEAPYILGAVSLPDPLVTELIGSLSQKLVELRAMREQYSEEHPKVSLQKAQIDELKLKVRNAVSNGKKSLDGRFATVSNIIAGYEAQLKQLPQAERELAVLTRKSEVNAELYTFLLKKHEESRIARAGIVGNVRVLDPALSPETPVAPKKGRNLALALFFGLLLGVGIAFFFEYLDDSIKGMDEVEREFGLNSYGVIPFVDHLEDSPVVLSKIDPRSPVQEAFRTLRTNITFSGAENQFKTIICVGAVPGVGKTTVTCNLASILAQGGKKVLLVDCDLRRPQLHKFFALDNEPGLTNALVGDSPWKTYVNEKTGVEHLAILTSGPLPPNPVEFLASPRFQAFMQEAEAEYDHVLYDAPPIVAFTDAALVAAKVSAVFMVIELGRSSRPLTRRALDLLANVQSKVRGAILNKATSARHGEHYYDYYTYGYQHYYESNAKRQKSQLARVWNKIVG